MKRPIKIFINISLFIIFTTIWCLILKQDEMVDISYLYVGF